MRFGIERKLRQYTRHPTMGGTTSIQQTLLDEAADEIERLREAATRAADIIDTHLNTQREKVADASAILRDALAK